MKTTFLCLLVLTTAYAAERVSPAPRSGNSLSEVDAAPEKGFRFPYLIFIPKSAERKAAFYLLVEPNNTGRASDELEVHRTAAIALARDSSVGNFVSEKLGIPLLVPIFPRPSNPNTLYTHSLDRDTILISDGPLKRLDLQLLAMVTDAKERLTALGRSVNSKILVNGFSASGLFANRFTFLHPEAVAAAAYGGVNGFVMLPVKELDEQPLEFPLGLGDFEKVTGHPFDRVAYTAVSQFAYMGEKDQNDAVVHHDAYSDEERELIFKLLGRPMMPDRWKAVEVVYQKENLPVRFKTYEGMGHGTDGKINGEVAEFFRSVMEESR